MKICINKDYGKFVDKIKQDRSILSIIEVGLIFEYGTTCMEAQLLVMWIFISVGIGPPTPVLFKSHLYVCMYVCMCFAFQLILFLNLLFD